MANRMEKYKRIAKEREEQAKVVRDGGMYPPEQHEAEKEARREAARNHKKAIKPDRMENIYKEIVNMSDAEIEKRIQEIDNRIHETEDRRRDIFKAVKGISAKEGHENKREKLIALNSEFEDLKKEAEKLKKEKERFINFPEVKVQIARIRNLRDKTKENKKTNLAKAKLDLKQAKEALNKREKNVKEIEAESKKIENYQKKFAKDIDIKDEDREGYIASIKRLEALRDETKGEFIPIQELKERVKEADKKVKEYQSGKSKEDSIINKCDMAWKMLLAGKSWDEISLAAMEDIKEKRNIKTETQTEKREESFENTKIEENNFEEKEMSSKEQIQNEKFEFIKGENKTEDSKQHEEKENVYEKLDDENDEYEVVKWGDKSKAIRNIGFAERHPRLAKIPFLAKIMDKIEERREKKRI